VTDVIERNYPADVTCNFCLKKRKEVFKMIAGPCGYICDKCIKLSAKILDVHAKQIEDTKTKP